MTPFSAERALAVEESGALKHERGTPHLLEHEGNPAFLCHYQDANVRKKWVAYSEPRDATAILGCRDCTEAKSLDPIQKAAPA